MPIFACIGSREIDSSETMRLLEDVGFQLVAGANLVRSGGARGSDTCWMAGAIAAYLGSPTPLCRPIIYTPVRNHVGGMHAEFEHDLDSVLARDDGYVRAEATRIARAHHPRWNSLSPFVRRLMIRNVLIVLGGDLDSHADCVMAWTPTGQATGGTGHGLRIARTYEIPVRNLGQPAVRDAARAWASSSHHHQVVR